MANLIANSTSNGGVDGGIINMKMSLGRRGGFSAYIYIFAEGSSFLFLCSAIAQDNHS